jgi:hypothetical protein
LIRIPGIGGQRAPHPPLDFAHENPDDPRSAALDGGLPRHLIRGCDAAGGCVTMPPLNAVDFSKTLEKVAAFRLPEEGTGVEQLAMAAHGKRFHATFTQEPKPKPAQFTLNGLPAVAGAPYADPCINYSRAGGKPPGLVTRRYKAADIQLDAVFNKEGWHFPQQRMLALWGDVQVRTLVTGQINPHNLAIHGVHWLSQPGWDDSGWRGSQMMGISEHFEQIFRLPSWVSTPAVGTTASPTSRS